MKPIPAPLHRPLRHLAIAIFLAMIGLSALFAQKGQMGHSHSSLIAKLSNQAQQLAEQETELESLQALKQHASAAVSRITRLPIVNGNFGSTSAGKAHFDERRLSGIFTHEAALLKELDDLTRQPGAAACIRRCEIRLVSQNAHPALAVDCSLLTPSAMGAIQ